MNRAMYSIVLAVCLTAVTYAASGTDQGETKSETCPQALGCMKSFATIGQDPCRAMKTVVDCIGNLNSTCTLKEEKITFKKMQDFYTKYCEIMSGIPMQEIAGCKDLAACVKDSAQGKFFEIFGVQSPTAEQKQTMANTLLDANNWCMNAESGASCFIANADSCKFDAGKVKSLKEINAPLTDVCGSSSSASVTTQISSALVLLVVAFVPFFSR